MRGCKVVWEGIELLVPSSSTIPELVAALVTRARSPGKLISPSWMTEFEVISSDLMGWIAESSGPSKHARFLLSIELSSR